MWTGKECQGAGKERPPKAGRELAKFFQKKCVRKWIIGEEMPPHKNVNLR
jgi:hypothetical protein